MTDNQFKSLLKRYLAGEATEDERTFLRLYFRENNKVEKSSLDAEHSSTPDYVLEEQIRSIVSKEQAISLSSEERASFGIVRTVRLRSRMLAVAASVVFVLATGVLIYRWVEANGWSMKDASIVEVATDKGQRKRITLTDGSEVWLNSQSVLRFPRTFSGARRNVYLSGEAYFKVAHDRLHPFLVKTKLVTTRVLGTEFNVRAYSDILGAQITLLKGSVMLTRSFQATAGRSKKPSKADTLYLKPHEKAVYSDERLTKSDGRGLRTQSLKPILHKVEVNISLNDEAFKEGSVFTGERLKDVVPILERHYNVELSVAPKLEETPVYCALQETSAQAALLHLCGVLNRSRLSLPGQHPLKAQVSYRHMRYRIE